MTTSTTDQLYHSLSRLSRLIHRMEHQLAHGDETGHKIYRGQSRVLFLLTQTNDVSQRDMAEVLDIRPSSLTEMLLRMEQLGLISRRQDEKDQRIMRISLTEHGRQSVARSTDLAREVTDALFKDLSNEEQAQLLALISRVNASLETTEIGEGHHRGHHCHHKNQCDDKAYGKGHCHRQG